MRRGVCLAAAIGLMAAPAGAQSFEEAVRTNVGIALQLCITPHGGVDAMLAAFRASGFAERVERSADNSDTYHYFTAPADTARVEVYHGEMPEHCIVNADHVGVTEASAILDRVVPQVFPQFVRRVVPGQTDPATGRPAQCVFYDDPSNPIGLQIGVTAGAGAHACLENGTSVLFQSYRV